MLPLALALTRGDAHGVRDVVERTTRQGILFRLQLTLFWGIKPGYEFLQDCNSFG